MLIAVGIILTFEVSFDFLSYSVIFPASIFIVKYQKHRFGNAISLHRHIQLLTGFSITSLAAAAIATASPSMNQPHKMYVTFVPAIVVELYHQP